MTDPDLSANLVISAKDVPIAAYQAIYHRITKKTETFVKRYRAPYLITKNAVSDFHHKMSQILQQYQILSSNVELTVSLAESGVHTFSSFEKFEMFNLDGLMAQSQEFGIEIDFLIVLPSTTIESRDISQRYKVRIAYSERERIIYRRGIGLIVEEESSGEVGDAIVCRIEYADYAVARNIQALVEEWVKALPLDDSKTIGGKLQAAISNIEENIPFVGLAAPLLGGILFEPQHYANIISPIRYLLAVLLTMVLSVAVFVWISGFITKARRLLRPQTRLMFTSGDRANYDRQCKARAKFRSNCGLFLVAVVLATIVSIASNYISARIIDPSPASGQTVKSQQ